MIETTDGQNINWISSDLGRWMDNQWVFYGVMLFTNIHNQSLSLLNNSIGLSKSTSNLKKPEYIWLLKRLLILCILFGPQNRFSKKWA
jgi:hypothetical protein